jgi:hypothetical protein
MRFQHGGRSSHFCHFTVKLVGLYVTLLSILVTTSSFKPQRRLISTFLTLSINLTPHILLSERISTALILHSCFFCLLLYIVMHSILKKREKKKRRWWSKLFFTNRLHYGNTLYEDITFEEDDKNFLRISKEDLEHLTNLIRRFSNLSPTTDLPMDCSTTGRFIYSRFPSRIFHLRTVRRQNLWSKALLTTHRFTY